MMSRLSTAKLARASAMHPWRVIGVWLIVLVVAFVAMSGLDDALTTTANFTGKPDSRVGADLLKTRMRGDRPVTETVIVRSDSATVDDTAFRTKVDQTVTNLLALNGVVISAPTYYQALAAGSPDASSLISADRHTTIIPVTFAGDWESASDHVDIYLATIAAQGGNGFQVLTVGDLSTDKVSSEVAGEDLHHAETMSLPLTILILGVVFGALVAVGIPVVLSIVSIILALGLTAIAGRFTDLSFYVVNMITMIGLAVGVDYTLFIISRYREERQRGREQLEAIEIAGGTATKAVVFSGGTVVLALMGMFLIPLTVFHSLGAGAVLAAISAVAGTLTLVPAMLGLLGDKIDWPRRRRYDTASLAAQQSRDQEIYHGGFWGRITRVVMARPALFALLSIGLLVACALPYADLKRGSTGIDALPPSNVKTAYQILGKDFAEGMISPVEIVVDARASDPAIQTAITNLRGDLAQYPIYGVVTVTTNEKGDLILVSTPLKADGASSSAADAIWQLRNSLIPTAFAGTNAHIYVTGGPAVSADTYHLVDSSTPTVFGFVLGLSFLLLLLAFRSVIIAAKAIFMNLLSVGASYGLLVLVFQKGYLHGFFGFQQTPTIEFWVPIFLFCVLFGLSMDYHVFLLSRIREHFDQTGRNTESVAVGLQSTAKIITGAAGIMVVVFGAFATGKLVAFQQMGFGMAAAIFLDATVVRSILVPAAMALLGNRNWYLPRWLSWLPNLNVEGPAPTPATRPTLLATPAD